MSLQTELIAGFIAIAKEDGFEKMVTDIVGSTMYVGFSQNKSAITSDNSWRIFKQENGVGANNQSYHPIEYEDYTGCWDDRATYFYAVMNSDFTLTIYDGVLSTTTAQGTPWGSLTFPSGAAPYTAHVYAYDASDESWLGVQILGFDNATNEVIVSGSPLTTYPANINIKVAVHDSVSDDFVEKFFYNIPVAQPSSFSDTLSLKCEDIGSKNVDIPRNGSLYDFSLPITFGGWVYMADWTLSTEYIFNIPSVMYVQTYTSAQIRTRIFDAGNTTTFVTVPTLTAGWHFVAITSNGAGGHQLIIDDNIITNPNARTILSNTGDITMMERAGYGVSESKISDWFIINKVISQTELNGVVSGGKANDLESIFSVSELKHWWRMEESTSTWKDIIGSIDGIFQNSPSSSTEVPS